MEKKKNEPLYKWVIVILCCLMVMVALGFGSSTKSLFPDEIAKELEVERSLVSLGDTMRYVATSVVNIFFGVLIAKFGAKKLICAGFVCLITSMLLYGYATNIPTILLAGSFLGIGFSWTTTTMVGYVVNIWHPERKGTIMGVILASNGIGGAIAIELVGSMIDPTVTGSYRAAYKTVAIIFAAMLLLLLVFLKDKKQDGAVTVAKKAQRGRDWEGLSFFVLTHKPYFWVALVCVFFTGFVQQGSYGIVAMHFKDVGIDYGAVRSILSFTSILLSLVKFLTGFMYDKLGLRVVATACISFSFISTVLFASVNASKLGFAIAIAYVLCLQFAMPLDTVMLPIFASDLCGRHSYDKVVGIFVSVSTAGIAIAAPVMNLCHDILGSYVPIIVMSGVVMLAVLIAMQFVISAAHKEQKRLETDQ